MKDFYSLLVDDEANFTEDLYIRDIMSVLPPSPDDVCSTSKFLMPYIKHNSEDVINVREKLITYIGKCLSTNYFNNINLNILQERKNVLEAFYCNPGFYTVWKRFACIDDDFREWCFIPNDYMFDRMDISKCTCLNDVDDTIKVFFKRIDRDNILNEILFLEK